MADTRIRDELELDIEDLDVRDVGGEGARVCTFCGIPCQSPEAEGRTD